MNWRATTRRLLPYLIVSAAGFLVAYLVVFAVVFPSGVVPDDGRVPAVVGLNWVDAQRRLAVAGYEADSGLQRFSPTAAEGTVLSQSPSPGTSLARGARVSLDVSAGARAAEVPPVLGASEQQARALLETAGFEVGSVTRRTTIDVARGAVAAATPAPGTRVPLPSRVELVVSNGPPRATVPDVVGRPIEEARRLLQQAGFETGQVAPDPAAVDLPNTVTTQSLPAGASAAVGTAVNLGVAGASFRLPPPGAAPPPAPAPPPG